MNKYITLAKIEDISFIQNNDVKTAYIKLSIKDGAEYMNIHGELWDSAADYINNNAKIGQKLLLEGKLRWSLANNSHYIRIEKFSLL